MEWYLKVLLYGVGGIAAAGMGLLVAFQEKLVYLPVLPGLSKSYSITPARLNLLHQHVWLTSFRWCSPSFLVHQALSQFPRSNHSVLSRKCWKYPLILPSSVRFTRQSYGASDGYPSQQGITKGAQAALDHLMQRTDIDTSQIVVFGRSLGGAVGSLLAKNNPDKIMVIDFEITYPSATAAAHFINNFHTTRGTRLSETRVEVSAAFFPFGFLIPLTLWFPSVLPYCGSAGFFSFGWRACANKDVFYSEFSAACIGAGMMIPYLTSLSLLFGIVLYCVMWPLTLLVTVNGVKKGSF